MRKVALPFLLVCLGCAVPADRVAKTAIQLSPAPILAAEQPNVKTATQEPTQYTDPNEIRFWVSPDELRPENWHTVGCVRLLRPECNLQGMLSLFGYYERSEGKPYLYCIIENWLRRCPRRTIRRNGWITIPVCEDAWQWGDLNADGRTDYKDLAIYAGTESLFEK